MIFRCSICKQLHEDYPIGARCSDVAVIPPPAPRPRIELRNDHGFECTCLDCWAVRSTFNREVLRYDRIRFGFRS